jgi:hypothetical protein
MLAQVEEAGQFSLSVTLAPRSGTTITLALQLVKRLCRRLLAEHQSNPVETLDWQRCTVHPLNLSTACHGTSLEKMERRS